MDRKTTIKTLREIIRVLKDDLLFYDSDFEDISNPDLDYYEVSRVKEYLKKRLEL